MTSNREIPAEVIYRALAGKYGDFSHHEETADALAAAVLTLATIMATPEEELEDY